MHSELTCGMGIVNGENLVAELMRLAGSFGCPVREGQMMKVKEPTMTKLDITTQVRAPTSSYNGTSHPCTTRSSRTSAATRARIGTTRVHTQTDTES